MSAYVFVEFTVKDPDVYREKYAGNAGKSEEHASEILPPVTGRSCMASLATSGASCGFRTMRRPKVSTTHRI